MLALDRRIVEFFNSFAQRSWTFDAFVRFLASNDLLKGILVVCVIYFVWFQAEPQSTDLELTEKRQILLHTILICIPGLIVTRVLALVLPFRERPLYVPELHLHRAYTFDSNSIETWSSFPSDHAALFFALATAVFFVHRKAGTFLYLHAILCVALPRLFLGVHYPSDLLVGAFIGVGFAYSAKWRRFRSLIIGPALRLRRASPGLFYAGFFFLTEQTSELYTSVWAGGRLAYRMLSVWWHLLR